MPVDFSVIVAQPDDLISDEALGSKPKFWFWHEKERWRFKEACENTGEDWVEEIAAEIARAFDIPALIPLQDPQTIV